LFVARDSAQEGEEVKVEGEVEEVEVEGEVEEVEEVEGEEDNLALPEGWKQYWSRTREVPHSQIKNAVWWLYI
jgi:hypothetical protein